MRKPLVERMPIERRLKIELYNELDKPFTTRPSWLYIYSENPYMDFTKISQKFSKSRTENIGNLWYLEFSENSLSTRTLKKLQTFGLKPWYLGTKLLFITIVVFPSELLAFVPSSPPLSLLLSHSVFQACFQAFSWISGTRNLAKKFLSLVPEISEISGTRNLTKIL